MICSLDPEFRYYAQQVCEEFQLIQDVNSALIIIRENISYTYEKYPIVFTVKTKEPRFKCEMQIK
jgi:hypothetical protein